MKRVARVVGLVGLCVLAQLLFSGQAPAASFPANAGSLGAISDSPGGGFPSPGPARDVTFNVAGLAGAPANVAISLTGTHSYVGDLDAVLIAPDGTTQQTIFSRTGATSAPSSGDASNLGGTYTFSDSAPAAPTWWTAAATAGDNDVLAPGSYRASTPGGAGGNGANALITPAFAGLTNPNGTWTLRFRDLNAGDTGEITAASLDITALSDGILADPATLGAIPDGTGVATYGFGAFRSVEFDVTGTSRTPSDVSVSIALDHTSVGDIRAELVAPDGVTTHVLFSRTGALAAGEYGDNSDLGGVYTFTDSAPASPSWWDAAQDPGCGNACDVPSGSYRTSTGGGAASGGQNRTMSDKFAGLIDSNGTWTLRLIDGWATDGADLGTGSVTGASLNLTESSPLPGTRANVPSLGAIPDGTASPAGSFGPPRDVTFDIAGTEGAPTDVGVSFVGRHAYTGDVDMTLIAPDGTTQTKIFSRTGARTTNGFGEASNLGGRYVFSDSAPAAPTWWERAEALGCDADCPILGGSFRASEPGGTGSATSGANTLITPAFAGLASANGTWTLRFRDGSSNDTGAIGNAGLQITTAGPPVTPTPDPGGDPGGGNPGGGDPGGGGSTADTTAPDTTVKTAKSTIKTKKKSVTVKFDISSNEPGSSFTCKLDSAASTACGATQSYKLKRGNHKLTVTAKDAAGNSDATPATATVKVVKKKKKKGR